MAEASNSSGKIGQTALKAFLRQGLAELRAAAPLADSPIAQHTDYGMWGMSTQGEISQERREEMQQIDETSVVGSRLAEIGRDDYGKDDRNKGMDME